MCGFLVPAFLMLKFVGELGTLVENLEFSTGESEIKGELKDNSDIYLFMVKNVMAPHRKVFARGPCED